jgi:hypothetical protein
MREKPLRAGRATARKRRLEMRTKLGLVLLVSALGTCADATGAEAEGPRISVGPNILVSRDGDIPHVELMLATSPRTAKNLLGGAITFTRPSGGMACRAYSSTDGGITWKASEFPEQADLGGGDPQVAYTAQGTALFIALAFVKDETGRGRAGLHVYRSEDGGKSWGAPADLGYSYDHEQVVVDTTKGRFAGRIYIGALYLGPYPVYRVGVFRSDDDGRTWTGPVDAANGGGTIGINVVTPMVLSDGTLLVPYVDFEFRPEKIPAKGKGKSNLWLVSSSDGGVTFSPPRKVLTQEFRPMEDRSEMLGLAPFPKFAADFESKSYRDRIYVAFEDYRLGSYRILSSWSSDRGKTWSQPRPVDGRVAKAVHQFQPALAVNKEGVVAVTWFDTRDSADGKQYHQYLAASLDGGASFLPSVRVSSDPSDPRGAGNRRQMTPSARIHKERVVLSFLSAAGWTAGGHYMGLAADKDGDFHPFWVDARTGTSQIYTARVNVEVPPKKPDGKEAGGEVVPTAAKSAGPPLGEPTTLLERVELVFDQIQYDAEKSEIAVPVRLKNVSQSAIHPPIRIEFVGFGSGEPQSEVEKEFWKDKMTTIVNAANGKPGEGAVFEFDRALAGSETLEPGAQTNPVVVRLKLSDPFYAPDMRWNVTGRVAGSP